VQPRHRHLAVAALVVACIATPRAHASVGLGETALTVAPGTAGSTVATVQVPAGPRPFQLVRLDLVATGPADGWVAAAPLVSELVQPPVDVPFTVVVAVPADTPPAVVAYTVVAYADDVEVGRTALHVTVPGLAWSLRRAGLSAAWSESRFRGSLSLQGEVGASSRIDVTLRRVGDAAPPLVLRTSARAGRFAIVLGDLPETLLPGAYALRAQARSGGRSAEIEQRLTLAGPPEGVVDRAWATTRRNGPPVLSVPGPRRELWASFRFASPPVGGRATLVFRPPGDAPPLLVGKPIEPLVTGYVRTTDRLKVGRWRVELRVRGRVVRRLEIELRP
jgi:hypothetical protein